MITGLMLIIFCSMSISCEKEPNNNEAMFIIEDYQPDLIIAKDDTVFIDINEDGIDDLKIFQHKYSSGENPIFESIDTFCHLSLGKKYGTHINSWIFKSDSINNNLTWEQYIPWIITEMDSLNTKVYLGIRLKDKDGNFYFGWLLPKIEDVDFHSYKVYIDKYVFNKLKNQIIMAGQDKVE
jgi:hypothetical protein